MIRYTVQLFGITVFAIALIWFVGSGEAVQTSTAQAEPVLWADTVHINVDEITPPENTEKVSRDTFLSDVKKLTQTAFNIRNQYMEEVDTKEIIKAGIVGMLEDLDRFSVLMEKNAVIGPNDARTASVTASVAINSRNTEAIVSREPTSALKTYSDGNVTTSVRKNSAGTLTVVASNCSYTGGSRLISANHPMKNP